MDEKWGSPILGNLHMLPLYESADANFKFDGPLSCLEFLIEPQQNDTMEDMDDFSVVSSIFEHLCNEVPFLCETASKVDQSYKLYKPFYFLGDPTIRRFREQLPSALGATPAVFAAARMVPRDGKILAIFQVGQSTFETTILPEVA